MSKNDPNQSEDMYIFFSEKGEKHCLNVRTYSYRKVIILVATWYVP